MFEPIVSPVLARRLAMTTMSLLAVASCDSTTPADSGLAPQAEGGVASSQQENESDFDADSDTMGESDGEDGTAGETSSVDTSDDRPPELLEGRETCDGYAVAVVEQGPYKFTFCVFDDGTTASIVDAPQDEPFPQVDGLCALEQFLAVAAEDALVPAELVIACGPMAELVVKDDADLTAEGATVADFKPLGLQMELEPQADAGSAYCSSPSNFVSTHCGAMQVVTPPIGACGHTTKTKDRCKTSGLGSSNPLDTNSCDNLSGQAGWIAKHRLGACNGDATAWYRSRSGCSGSYTSWTLLGTIASGRTEEITLQSGWQTCSRSCGWGCTETYTCHNAHDINLFASCGGSGKIHWGAAYVRNEGDFQDHLGCSPSCNGGAC